MNILRLFDENIPKVLRVLAFIGGLSVIIMIISMTREVIGRYFFNAPTSWVVEICEHLMVVFTFLAGPYLLVLNAHVKVDIFYQNFTGRTKVIIDLIIDCLSIVYFGVLSWQSFLYSGRLLANWTTSSGGLGLPLFPIQVTVTIGTFLICLECVRRITHSTIQLYGRYE